MKIKKILVFSVVFVLLLCASFITAHAASYHIVVTNGTTIHESFNNFVYGNTWKEFCERIHAFDYNEDYVFYKGHKVMFNGEFVKSSDPLQSATYTLVECEHSFTDWIVDIEATCEEDGSKFRYCTYCETEQLMVIPAHGHSKNEYKVIEPSCTEPGESYYSCLYMCGAKLDLEYTPATGHSYSNWVIESVASCTEYGVKTRVCNNCLLEEYITTSPFGHTSLNETITREATCSENGEKTGVCDTCGEAYTSTIPRKGHTYSEATCTEAPMCIRCCDIWGAPLGHYLHEADCDDPVRCTRCDYTEGEALGHDFEWGSCKRCDLFDPFYWIGDIDDLIEDDPITDFFDGVNDGISTMNKNLDELLSTILGFCFIFVVIWGVPKIYRKIKSARKPKYHNNYNYYRRK